MTCCIAMKLATFFFTNNDMPIDFTYTTTFLLHLSLLGLPKEKCYSGRKSHKYFTELFLISALLKFQNAITIYIYIFIYIYAIATHTIYPLGKYPAWSKNWGHLFYYNGFF